MIAPAKTRVTTPFGWVFGYPLYNTSYPGFGNAPGPGYGFHTGVDFSWSPDDIIYMPEDGVVQVIKWNGTSNDGNAIVVAVENRRHFMGHMSKFLVANGQFVEKGTPIGVMGDTGFAIGKHLHWGLRIDGQIVNGLNYVTEENEMTQQEAYGVVSQIYRVATDVDPEPGQADYWAKRIQADPATAAELASALGGNDYKGDPNFRYYGRHYSEDMTTAKQQAYDAGFAAGGGKDPKVEVNDKEYVPKQ